MESVTIPAFISRVRLTTLQHFNEFILRREGKEGLGAVKGGRILMTGSVYVTFIVARMSRISGTR